MAMRINRNTFKWSAWLGWQMESNWTRPFIFAIYAIVRPIAGALIIMVMFAVYPAVKHSMKNSRKASSNEWISVIIPIGLVALFVYILTKMV